MMSTETLTGAVATAHHQTTITPSATVLAVKAIAALVSMGDRRRQRGALADLDDHLLRDIGLTRYEARIEARKPFWLR